MQSQEKISLHTQTVLVLVCSIAYFYAYQLNLYWFDWFEFSYGTNWVYLPSGLRLLLVLVLPETGALAIAAASLYINYSTGSPDAHVFNIVTSALSAAAPYVSRLIAIHFLNLSSELSGLTSAGFFKISVMFALFSATVHQIWFYWQGVTDHWLESTFAMGMGDWLGTVLVLAFASLMIKGYKFMADTFVSR
ncbi:hypothetical protein [Limnohabitans sp.]|uniref:hypothetical protein n=1 Tax=Limnohabitans sp. TaxID=1907725 RepID=UPI00286F06CA|nr:hypothetical protein [Limnohabitans sp.]